MGQVVFGSFSRPARDWAWCLCKGVGRLGFGLWVIGPEGNNTLGYGLATGLAWQAYLGRRLFGLLCLWAKLVRF